MKSRKTDPSTFIAIRDFVPTLPAVFSQATATTAITSQAVGGFMNRSSTSAPSPNTLVKTVNKNGYKQSRWRIKRFLIGFVISKCANISAHLDVKNCTAVDKEKGLCSAQRMEKQLCGEKPTNAEIAVFLCRKLLLFGVRCGIMTDSDKMHWL